ncbi:MAG: carbohydrate-binding protein, partial [Armatimonadetes bacterium]|nr:carbohydrate-binding protein [Armatimonadota bacterium]
YISYRPVNLHGIASLAFRVSSAGAGGRIEVRADSPAGPLVSAVEVPLTGGWDTHTTVTAPVRDPGGVRELFLVFLNEPGNPSLFNLDWVEFNRAPIRGGDLNRDGFVNVQDAVVALRMIVGFQPVAPFDLETGDMNGDGAIDIRDVVAILALALNLP